MLDTLFAMARSGVDGVNIHTLPTASYKPFEFRRIRGRWLATVEPEYYALLMFEQAAPPGLAHAEHRSDRQHRHPLAGGTGA